MILAMQAYDTYRCIESYARNPGSTQRLAFLCLFDQVERELSWLTAMHSRQADDLEALINLRIGHVELKHKAKTLQEMTAQEKKDFYIKAMQATGKQVDPASFSGKKQA